jgi:enoyl-CoA hydratase/carnithine racemase
MVITINQPEVRNAINRAVSTGVSSAIDGFEGRPALRVTVLTGAGGNFCSGAGLKAFLQGEDSSAVGFMRWARRLSGLGADIAALSSGRMNGMPSCTQVNQDYITRLACTSGGLDARR